MNRVFIPLAFLCFLIPGVRAQVNIAVQEPPAGIVQKTQLWNLSLIYSGDNAADVTIGLSLVDVNDNQPVLTGYSRQITLTRGVKVIRTADVSPIDYTYVSPGFNRPMDAFIPIGSYRACYTVYAMIKGTEYPLAENCINLEVQPLSPPQLTMPSDAAVIQNAYPQFSWLPPAPISLFTDLNYDLFVTEVRDDQTPGAAIQENLPVYNARRLTTVVNNYPSSHMHLDTGKAYAWRIIARNGESFAAQSEVWTFRVSKDQPEKPVPAGNAYIALKSSNASVSTGVIPDNVLGIKYYSYDKTHEIPIRFFNEKGEKVKEIRKTIEYGNNFLVFTLDHSFQKGSVYFIEITDSRSTRHRAAFTISNQTATPLQ